MSFDIKNKVALITGGASGIGLRYAKEVLKNGAKAVVLADINEQVGAQSVKEIEGEFGRGKAIFVKTDVTDVKQFENAFKETVNVFKQVDILFNNAGILNDAVWEKEIAININGTINGVLLGLENYLPKYKSGDEAVIVNIASVAGTDPISFLPVYCATKAAVIALTMSWGDVVHYNRTKVRVVAVAPGVTDTPLISDAPGRNLGPVYDKLYKEGVDSFVPQTPEQLAEGMIEVLKKAPSGTTWVIEAAEPPFQYTHIGRFDLKNKVTL